MTHLPPHLDLLEADVVQAARRRARQLRRRRLTAQIAAVAIAALVLAGAGLAAGGVIQDWLSGGDPATSARFSIDPSRRYEGPAPAVVVCESTAGAVFDCRVGASAAVMHDAYALLLRIERPFELTRENLLRQLDRVEREGKVSRAVIADARDQVAAVDDEFLAALALVGRLSTLSVGFGDERGDLEPPAGRPALIVCETVAGGHPRCRPLAGASGIASGTPVYAAVPDASWRPRKPGATVESGGTAQLLPEILGRPLTAAELRLLVTLSTPAEEDGGGGSSSTASEPATTP